MAGPSASELARKAQQDLLLLKTQFDALVKDLDSAEVRRLRERLAVVESRTAELEKSTEQLKPTEAKSEEMGALKTASPNSKSRRNSATHVCFRSWSCSSAG